MNKLDWIFVHFLWHLRLCWCISRAGAREIMSKVKRGPKKSPPVVGSEDLCLEVTVFHIEIILQNSPYLKHI